MKKCCKLPNILLGIVCLYAYSQNLQAPTNPAHVTVNGQNAFLGMSSAFTE